MNTQLRPGAEHYGTDSGWKSMSLANSHLAEGGAGGPGGGGRGPGGACFHTAAAQPAVAAQVSQQRDKSMAYATPVTGELVPAEKSTPSSKLQQPVSSPAVAPPVQFGENDRPTRRGGARRRSDVGSNVHHLGLEAYSVAQAG